jgi:hypothetical protein
MLKKEEIDKLYDLFQGINVKFYHPFCTETDRQLIVEYQDLCDKLIALLYKAESEQSK